MRRNELPNVFRSVDERDGNEHDGSTLARNQYLLLLILRWIVSVYNENEHSALRYDITWEMGGGTNHSRPAPTRNVTLFVTITDNRSGKTTKRELVVLERTCRDAIGVVQFANGPFGSYRMSGPEGIKHLICEVVHAPRPSRLSPPPARASVTMKDVDGVLQIDTLHPGRIQPEFDIKLDAAFCGDCTTITVEQA